MKTIVAKLWLLLFCGLLLSTSAFAQKQGEGRRLVVLIVDEKTGESLPGAVVSLNKKDFQVTDIEGKASFAFPSSKAAKLAVQMLGYQPYETQVKKEQANGKTLRIQIKEQVESLDDVTVIANKPRTVATSIAVQVSQARLKESTGKNLAEILSQLPGLSSISTGATIMKPVIQGMHSSRILLINNGVRQEGQQWGADHAPEVDASSATELEVIKGAESIRYGAGAIGGVILLNSASLPKGDKLSGNAAIRSGLNPYRAGMNVDLMGGGDFLSNFRWRAQLGGGYGGDYATGGTSMKAKDYNANPSKYPKSSYVLNNTGSRELSAAFTAGFKTKQYEVSAFGSYYHTELGVFFGSHIGNLEDLYDRFETGRPDRYFDRSFEIQNPRQQVNHVIGRVDGKWIFDNDSRLKVQYDYQKDVRKEFEIRKGDNNNLPVLGLTLDTHSLQAGWETSKRNDWRLVVGSSGSYQVNKSDDNTRFVPIVPNFLAENVGLWVIGKYAKPTFEVEAGARYDYKYLHADGYDNIGNRYGSVIEKKAKQYNSPTFTLSAMYAPSNLLRLHTNLGLAWRAPEVSELYSSGLHHGAGTFELGDKNLKPEQGLKWSNEIQLNSTYLSINSSGFVQWIKNYIYAQPSRKNGKPETQQLVNGFFPVFRYKQNPAFFYGGDLVITVRPPIENLSYTLQGEWIRAENLDTHGYFPYIPSDKYSQKLEWSKIYNRSGINKLSIAVMHQYVTKQKNFDPSIDFVDVTPDAYHLVGLNASLGLRINKMQRLEISLMADNLLNELYKEYTNRFRYYAHEKGRDIQLRMRYEF
ncbi:TonB-dependent receptor [Porphyromonas crevioricanis]|uniref:Outer membrane hemin receptor n=2 Tax=Porphyromonas crevioricanis TaxID=393921 RepID=T1DTW8_9PORP|nr:TonB-dependent receptor [Porphyromonas crevioricanis]GAD06069.1 outer membrane hemin receptor [Porphyromonas crevioricanis JCM 15906]GAD06981.1 outer membrane hemin receptor [Porphyromonas crevioricanis JCM 13913]SJZ62160.1 iron complex outermembrane recepter protein [Porphyromonas crevioricanis]SQH72856.1 Probable TonB-dependent receptor NMB0964 precursor [Porphyromonas crevioricanis]